MITSPQPADAISGLTILVVEDQFLLADLAREFLLEAGAADVLLAKDVGQALDIIAHQPSLGAAVIDINLGGPTGLNLADTLIERGIPFVFVSGYGRGADIPPALRQIPLVSKPYTFDILMAALGGAVAGGGAGNPQT